jgi:hypothetical protein
MKKFNQDRNRTPPPSIAERATDQCSAFRVASIEFGHKLLLVVRGVQIDHHAAISAHNARSFRLAPTPRTENHPVQLHLIRRKRESTPSPVLQKLLPQGRRCETSSLDLRGYRSREASVSSQLRAPTPETRIPSGVISRPISKEGTAVNGGTPSPITTFPVYPDACRCQEKTPSVSIAIRCGIIDMLRFVTAALQSRRL